MNQIQALIHTFSFDQEKNFRQFLQRNARKKDRKDLILFDIYRAKNSVNTVAIISEIYGELNDKTKNAYHSLRKRLFADLSDYIYLKRVEIDDSKSTEINKLMTLVDHLVENNLNKMAWKNLLKAEKIGVRFELNDKLVTLYDKMIQFYSASSSPYSLANIIKKRIEVNRLYQEEETLEMISSLIKEELDRIRLEGKDINLQQLSDRLIERFGLSHALFKRPKLLYNFVFLTRSIMLGKKDYQSFEGFLINSYKKIDRSGFFEKNTTEHLHIQYAIAHTLYRNKKFEDASFYLNKMKRLLEQTNKSIHQKYYPKYLLLSAAVENFNGNLHQSIVVLEELLQLDFVKEVDLLNARLNLSVYHFEDEAFKTANQVLIQLPHTDSWLEKYMGIEWRLKKNMIESIYQYEIGNSDIAYDRLESIERTFEPLLKTAKYNKVAVFISLMKKVINNPTIAQTDAFHETVEGSFDWVGFEQEDLQEMSYYAWLKSKMLGQKFYPVLLDLIATAD